MVKLGMHCRDKITGFSGIVTGLVEYISGCNQALLVPSVDDNGALRSSEWFDVQRMEQTEQPSITLDNGATPGCDRAAPKR